MPLRPARVGRVGVIGRASCAEARCRRRGRWRLGGAGCAGRQDGGSARARTAPGAGGADRREGGCRSLPPLNAWTPPAPVTDSKRAGHACAASQRGQRNLRSAEYLTRCARASRGVATFFAVEGGAVDLERGDANGTSRSTRSSHVQPPSTAKLGVAARRAPSTESGRSD